MARADACGGECLVDALGAPLAGAGALRVALILDRIRLPQALFPDLTETIFAEREATIYALYQSRYTITVVRTEESIAAALADLRTCELLRLTPPAAVLRVVRTAYAWRNRPVDTRVRQIATRRHHYRSVLGQR